MDSPVKLTTDELNALLKNFAEDGDGITAVDIVRLCSSLLDTGAVRFIDPDIQTIVASFIRDGVLNFAGEILVPDDEIFSQIENMDDDDDEDETYRRA